MIRRSTSLIAVLLLSLCSLVVAPSALAGKIEANVTLSSYWVSNYKYFHSNTYVNLEGLTGTAWPDTELRGRFRSDFVGSMTEYVNWQNVTKRQLMSVRGMSWGMVDFGDGNGGPNKYWAEKYDKATNT